MRQAKGTVRLRGIPMSYFGEMMLIWKGNKLVWKRYTHKPVSPLWNQRHLVVVVDYLSILVIF